MNYTKSEGGTRITRIVTNLSSQGLHQLVRVREIRVSQLSEIRVKPCRAIPYTATVWQTPSHASPLHVKS